MVEDIAPHLGLSAPDVDVRADAEAHRRTEAQDADGLLDGGVIYLNPRVHDGRSTASRAVLDHEVAHLAQTRSGAPKAPNAAAAEHEADAIASAHAAGVAVPQVGVGLPSTARAAKKKADRDAPKAPKLPAATKEELAAAKQLATPQWLQERVLEAHAAGVKSQGVNVDWKTWSRPLWEQAGLKGKARSGAAGKWFDKATTEAFQRELQALLKDTQSARWFSKDQERLKSQAAKLRKADRGDKADAVAAVSARRASRFEAMKRHIASRLGLGAGPEPKVLAQEIWALCFHLGEAKSFPRRLRWVPNSMRRYLEATVKAMVPLQRAEIGKQAGDIHVDVRNAATEEALELQRWVVEQSEMVAFVDRVLARLGPSPSVPDDESREKLRARAQMVLAVGEVGALSRELWGKAKKAPNTEGEKEAAEASWRSKVSKWLGGGREYNMRVYTLPTWQFYKRHIVGFSFLGWSTGKRNGMHRSLVARLPIVEATINQQGRKDQKHAFYGFRFQLSGKGGNHPRGRAFDTDSHHNAFVSDPVTRQIITLITGTTLATKNENNSRDLKSGDHLTARGRFEKDFAARAEQLESLSKVDGQIAEIGRHLRELRPALRRRPARRRRKAASTQTAAQLKATREWTEARAHQTELKRMLAQLRSERDGLAQTAHAAVKGAAPGAEGLDHLKRIHNQLKAFVAAHGGESAPPQQLSQAVRDLLKAKREELHRQLASNAEERAAAKQALSEARAAVKGTGGWYSKGRRDAREQFGKPTAAQLKAATEARRRAHKAARRQLFSADRAFRKLPPAWRLRSQLNKLDGLDGTLQRDAKKYFGDAKSSSTQRSIKAIAKFGLTNLPKYLVEGFMMSGWRWGGTWSTSDAMHFEYPIPLTGLKD
jgi:hypothetical protein